MTVTKRFIAGAVCPRCSAMDRIVTYVQDDIQHRECVECDYTDSMSLNPEPPVDELPTRVNQTEADPRDDVQVVKLVNPKG